MILSLLIFFTSILISKLSQLQQEIATVYQLSAPYDVIHHREVLPSAQSPSLALHAISSVIKSMLLSCLSVSVSALDTFRIQKLINIIIFLSYWSLNQGIQLKMLT